MEGQSNDYPYRISENSYNANALPSLSQMGYHNINHSRMLSAAIQTTPSPKDMDVMTIATSTEAFRNAQEVPSSQTTVSGCQIYFIFNDCKFDEPSHPNKIHIAKRTPTVKDFASLLKTVFHITAPMGFSWVSTNENDTNTFEETEQSSIAIPVNSRSAIIYIKTLPQAAISIQRETFDNNSTVQSQEEEEHSEPSPTAASPSLANIVPSEISELLRSLPLPLDVIQLIESKPLDRESLREINDQSLKQYGVNNLECRAALLQAIQQFKYKRGTKRGLDAKESVIESPQKRKKKINQYKFKDLDILINSPNIPISVGHVICCRESPGCYGVIVYKGEKHCIEYEIPQDKGELGGAGRKRLATLSRFYKEVTGNSLLEKGDSWNNIVFFNHSAYRSAYPDDDITDVLSLPPKYLTTLEDIRKSVKGPKKAVSAFLYFCNEHRNITTSTNSPDFPKVVGEMWRGLSEESKRKYRIMEAQDKIRFQQEKALWESGLSVPESAVDLKSANANELPIQPDSPDRLPPLTTLPITSNAVFSRANQDLNRMDYGRISEMTYGYLPYSQEGQSPSHLHQQQQQPYLRHHMMSSSSQDANLY
ncbi:high mobility group protein B1 [Planoprotostelium fungivorum]|uniref:High mobility group protein B1 n=1 Tax=Planoprotostelium fungivorum TaxID=1890364 RepID=A0A2P6NAL9_9EUKA|nr:high mobility group protein B1 [Planoprotostelium fungivorum]